MRGACIDIGSNTTRLLVAERRDDGLVAVVQERAFTRLGRDLERGGRITDAKIAEVAALVAGQARAAREHRAGTIAVVATAAIRRAANRDAFAAAIGAASGLDVRVLSEEQEARLAFAGATSALEHPPDEVAAVVDVGGGSTEVAVGTRADGAIWCASVPLGSGALGDAHLRSDPPSAAELAAARDAARAALAGLDAPTAEVGIAVGGSATSLRRLVGPALGPEALAAAVALLCAAPAAEIALEHDLDPRRVRLLPAGILILDAASRALGLPLEVGCGGLREGVVLEQLAPAPERAA